jgi:hypothetical protein
MLAWTRTERRDVALRFRKPVDSTELGENATMFVVRDHPAMNRFEMVSGSAIRC